MTSNFAHKWEQERAAGLIKYYIRHLPGIMCILGGMILGDYLANKTISILFIIISLIVTLLFPIVAWLINQLRYRKYVQKSNK